MTSDFGKKRGYFFNNYTYKNKLNINFLKKKIKSKIVFFNPEIVDEKISKRLLNYGDYIIIGIMLFYMIIKNLFFNKTKIFIRTCIR